MSGLIRFMEAGNHDIASPGIAEGYLNYDLSAYASSYTAACRRLRTKGANACCMLIRREVFDRVGRFDERFIYGGCEDIDFFWRCRSEGVSMATTGSCLIHHFSMKTQDEIKKKQDFDYARHNRDEFLKKWGRTPDGGRLKRKFRCGHRKTSENCIGVDIIPRGEKGRYGCVNGRISVADIHASGDELNMFKDRELDFVISRHNLEHYVDVVKTLQEWKRVIKIGGLMANVLPDESNINTIVLDPTHKHAFTPESYQRLLGVIGGFEIIKCETVIPDWSFVCIARRIS